MTMTGMNEIMAGVKVTMKAPPGSTLEGVRRMVRADRRYAADLLALQTYLLALELLIPPESAAGEPSTRPATPTSLRGA